MNTDGSDYTVLHHFSKGPDYNSYYYGNGLPNDGPAPGNGTLTLSGNIFYGCTNTMGNDWNHGKIFH